MAQPDSALTADLLFSLSKDLARMRVLLVDGQIAARNSLRILLSTLGVKSIHGAGTAAEVVRQVKANNFDIILSDYHLDDGRDGQQLLEELRQQHLISSSTVFIVITAERGYHNVVSLAELSPDDYLIKPFTADQLQGRLARAIQKKRHFARLLEALDRGAYASALDHCDALLAQNTPFVFDCLRFKGETLNTLERYDDARLIYQRVLDTPTPPAWARMGMAVALRGKEQLEQAELLAADLIDDFPEFLAAYDFVASVREEMGRLPEAQDILQQAAGISPNNTIRQRLVGDIAILNQDLDTAQDAYGRVLDRRQGSSLRSIDDYTNLSRVMIDNEHVDEARKVVDDLRRDWRGSKHGEMAALVMDSLCAHSEGAADRAKEALDKALTLHEELQGDDTAAQLSQKILVDLAHACLTNNATDKAQEIFSKVATENYEDRHLIARIGDVFTKAGMAEAGQTLLDKISREIVDLNNRGVLAARSGDLDASVRMLIETAQRVPNLQFLVNASKAIFTLIEQRGWVNDYADLGLRFIEQAQAKEPRHPKVISARELYQRVARKYGIATAPIGTRSGGEKSEA
ncbi:response regulator [uncultured Propionivibrio sp.]|uniref:response regulator n=1 Tax=uncultured Propionivibrio sp. TaxID=426737 RepID=UPI0029C09CC0|nr:response regulator [uncultured Propionivibrio sp.]